MLYQKTTKEEKMYLPINTLKKLIWECHLAYVHTGADKNHKIIKEHFYYSRSAKIVRQTLATCDSCQRNKIPTTAATAIIQESARGTIGLRK